MFIQNKYTKWYFNIIKTAQARIDLVDYHESHHIIPKCLGGSNDKINLVKLTAKEHFICHLLLTKMSNETGLKFALVSMTLANSNQTRYKITSSIYEIVKRENSKASSERMVGFVSYQKNKFMYHDESGKHKFFYKDEIIPDIWVSGFSDVAKQKIGNSNKNKVYYHDGNGKVIAIDNNIIPPSGFIKGNPNADTSAISNIKGSKYYHNIITGEEKRFKIHPGNNWEIGRCVKWITNGTNNKQYNFINDQLPDGWQFGRTKFK